MVVCPYCNSPITGYCCWNCGHIPHTPDATGDTGEDDYPYAHQDSPIGPWKEEEE